MANNKKKTNQITISKKTRKYIEKEAKSFLNKHPGFVIFLIILLIIFIGLAGTFYYLGYFDPIIDKNVPKDDDITAVWVWYESTGNGSYDLYIGYA